MTEQNDEQLTLIDLEQSRTSMRGIDILVPETEIDQFLGIISWSQHIRLFCVALLCGQARYFVHGTFATLRPNGSFCQLRR